MELDPTQPIRGKSRGAWLCLAAVAFVLAMVAWRYDSRTGFTELIRFGAPFESGRLPAVAAEPLYVYSNPGYDGQFYAQLAVDPDIFDPQVQAALDNPRYRGRRILLPAVVHALGAGNTWLTLNIYALVNPLAWLAFGWLLWRRVRADGWRGTAVWLSCMLSLGVLDSVRMALVDLPAMLLVFIAVEWSAHGKRIPALIALAAATLTRETSMLAIAAPEAAAPRHGRTWARHAINLAIVAAPLAIWIAWMGRDVPSAGDAGTGNFAAPFAGMLKHLARSVQGLAEGHITYRHLFGVVAVPGLLLQVAWVAKRAFSGGWTTQPWIRAALPFAILLLGLGDSVWIGYWAVARVCLPLTLAFNLTLPRDRRFWWMLIVGNATVLHGIIRCFQS